MGIKDFEIGFRMERRSFLKWSAAAGVAGMVMNFDQALAAGECAQLLGDMAPEKVAATLSKMGLVDADALTADGKVVASALNRDFLYWFDGPMIEGMEVGGAFRGRLAVFLDKIVPAGEFLETVMLTDRSRQILDERRFESSSATLTRKSPYVIFDNIELAKADHYVYFVISKTDGSSVTVYRYAIAAADVRMSRFDYAHLSAEARDKKIPSVFIEEMKTAGHAVEGSSEFGLITTPFQHFAGLPTHIVRAQFEFMDNTGAFRVFVEPMHDDADAGHWMRYFCVTDPVGRFLGVRRRAFPGAGVDAPTAAKRAHGDATLMGTRKFYAVTHGYIASGGQEDAGWAGKINTMDSNICDCPYVQVIAEDNRDAISRISIRLR